MPLERHAYELELVLYINTADYFSYLYMSFDILRAYICTTRAFNALRAQMDILCCYACHSDF